MTENERIILSQFLLEYVTIQPQGIDENGVIHEFAIQHAIQVLVINDILTPDEIAKGLLKDYNLLFSPYRIDKIVELAYKY